jgi:hypothetical protein
MRQLIAVLMLMAGGRALAEEAAKPGPETAAINTFTKSATWSGKLPPKKPGAPELTTRGKTTCSWFADGWWHLCDIEDTIGTGPQARTWKARWVSGWDAGAKEYRGFIFDNHGMSSAMRGKRDGNKLTYESMSDVMMRGQATRLRFTFDATDVKNVKFTAEHSVNGAFVIDEQETHVASGQ